MPSPFPGMDPWLEDPDIFPDLHDSLVGRLRDALNDVLPPSYFATIASRIVLDDPRQSFEPDVNVVGSLAGTNGSPPFTGNGGAAAVTATEPMVLVAGDEFRQKYLEIRTGPGGRQLVTVFEILSPSNKRAGENNRDSYIRKTHELLGQRVHVVEIDLLRQGEHSTLVPHELFSFRTRDPEYHICVSRFDLSRDYHVYPIRLTERLPNITVPLLPGDLEPVLSLQPILDRCYDSGRYASRIDYRQPANPPLTTEQVAWAASILAKK
jgi:uncharacterized protein DUF4058